MPRRINARRVKTHRSYRMDQLADTVGVTVQTVRTWCKQGLPCITDKRPYLIRGRDFKEFHQARLTARKHRLSEYEVFCLRCKCPRQPSPGLVDHEPMDSQRSRVMAICPTCEGIARRIIKARDLRKWAVKFGFATNMQEDA